MQQWPIKLEFRIDDKEFQKYIREAIDRGKDLRPALKQSGVAMMRSFADNFLEDGRPEKWKPLAENTIAQRRKKSRRVLQDTRRLMMSTISRVAEGNVYKLRKYELEMGTNLKIGPWHQFGTKPYTIDPKSAPQLVIPIPGAPIFAKRVNHPGIEPRPFVMIQREDEKTISDIFSDFLVGR